MLIAGIAIALLGGLFLFLAARSKRTRGRLGTAKAVPISGLQVGQFVELEGTIESQQPLQTPFSRRACVYYDVEVQREQITRQQQGQPTRSWQRVHSDSQSAPFVLRDGSGQVRVNPEGAAIDPQRLGEQLFMPGQLPSASFLQSMFQSLSNESTKVEEKALLVGAPGYVAGTVGQDSQGLVIQQGGKDFIVSYKSEAQYERDLGRSTVMLNVLGYLSIAGGIVLAVLGLVK